jgi:hypothetical protein
MENHRTDSIPNDSYPVKSDRLLDTSDVRQTRMEALKATSRAEHVARISR